MDIPWERHCNALTCGHRGQVRQVSTSVSVTAASHDLTATEGGKSILLLVAD